MATGLDRFAERLQSARLGAFEVRPYYERNTDSLICYFKDTRSYSKHVTKYFTVFLAMDDDTLVGFEVKSMLEIMRDTKGATDAIEQIKQEQAENAETA